MQKFPEIQFVKGVGPRIAKSLTKLQINSVRDFLFYIPRFYDDRRSIPQIIDLKIDEIQNCVGFIRHVSENQVKKGFSIIKCLIDDGRTNLIAVWFNQAYVKKTLIAGKRIFIKGRVEINKYSGERQITVTEHEVISKESDFKESVGRVLPIYGLRVGLYQGQMRKIAKEIMTKYLMLLPDPLPYSLIREKGLIDLRIAIRNLHFPESVELYQKARTRVAFDEFFYFQLAISKKRKENKDQIVADKLKTNGGIIKLYIKSLPYELTNAQKRAATEIYIDLQKNSSMNRLLQGDVGSGKTEVAVLTLLAAIESGKNAAIMAPTEVLAQQHYYKFKKSLGALGVEVVLLKGKMKAKEKRAILEDLKTKKPLIVIGTHALIQNDVEIPDLAVTVIDEQHRFGVVQRQTLKKKGQNPHSLFMTATPIPRSFMLTCYGDLEKSVIDEMPPGRKPPKTVRYSDYNLKQVYEMCRSDLKKGRQLYIVFPLVEESEKIDLKSAQEGWQKIKDNVFPEYNIGLMHGRLKPEEKNKVMDDFKKNKIQVLVATTVIEVGIDVPNASMMVIQHAERFGLSQLHQLRGRVGRGGTVSQCFLITEPKTESGKQRIQAMIDTTDGFKIAEYDLRIRGPGDMLGTRQAGLPDFVVADIIRDEKLLLETRLTADRFLKTDPNLDKKENAALRKIVEEQYHLAFGVKLD
jgi:ATP-dependent DNA helicase RecG